MASFFRSSIGKKFIQAVSGAFLVIFLLLHGTINFFSVIDSFKGTWGNVDPDKLMSAGDGVFAAGCGGLYLASINRKNEFGKKSVKGVQQLKVTEVQQPDNQ